MSFVTDQKALEYIQGFKDIEPVDLRLKYPGATENAIDFLQKILLFNPFFRMTIPDAIAHPLFDNVRGTKAEKYSGKPISLSFESQNLDKKTLRALFLEEIKTYH